MKKITFLLCVISLISCKIINKEKIDFMRFQNSIQRFPNKYKIGDTLTSLNDSILNTQRFIDTIFLKKYQLIDTTFETIYKPHTLLGYNCTFIGRYDYKNSILVLTHSIRTEAGDGNPILTLSSFSKDGKLQDLIKTDLEYEHDPELVPMTYFSISSNFEIYINYLEKKYKFDINRYQLTDSSSWITKYKIGLDGKFTKIPN